MFVYRVTTTRLLPHSCFLRQCALISTIRLIWSIHREGIVFFYRYSALQFPLANVLLYWKQETVLRKRTRRNVWERGLCDSNQGPLRGEPRPPLNIDEPRLIQTYLSRYWRKKQACTVYYVAGCTITKRLIAQTRRTLLQTQISITGIIFYQIR